jgi:hypothetical protein
MKIELFEAFRPVLGAKAYDNGGREVVGWIHSPRWRALLGWVELLIDRNIHGCLPFESNPEPWPFYYDGIEAAEMSHFSSPWYWSEVSENLALIALARTLTDVRRVYPVATPQQIQDVLTELGVI